jgi:hypothetical protein
VKLGRRALLARGARQRWQAMAGVMAEPGRVAFEVVFALAALSSAWPLFVARYVPIQDLPQHVAAVRVLHDFHTAAFAFERFFELELGSTQYLAVYLCAHLLSYAVDVVLATKLVLAASLVGLPYALRALLASLERPQSYALLSLPLLYNTQFILGFLNFALGLPLMAWGLALSLRYSTEQKRTTGLLLCAVSSVCFFAHVIPYGLLLLGAVLLGASRDIRRTASGLVPLVPSIALALAWLRASPAGRALVTLSGGGELFAQHESWGARLQELSLWLTDVLWTHEDETTLQGFGVLVGCLFCASLWVRGRASRTALRLSLLVPLCWLLYFVLPSGYEFIWPIHARFALLGLLLLIPVLPCAPVLVRTAVGVAALGLSLYGTRALSRAFRDCAEREYAGLPAVLDGLPYGTRVAGLIYDASSRYVRFSPYLHAVAWAQVERGGAVMFTFADFPTSPFRFREDNRPPRVPPRWEWLPARVDSEHELGFYDYVLTRSARSQVRGFHRLQQSGAWALWSRL